MVVNRVLSTMVPVPTIAKTLQAALDHWNDLEEALTEVYQALNRGAMSDAQAFDPHLLAAPLPRAYQWVDASAYVNHVELVRKARGAELPASFWTDPLVYQGGSDDLLGPCDPIEAVSEAHGIDLEAEVAVILDDVPLGISVANAAPHIKLFMLVNDVSLRNLIPNELAKGFGFYQGKPASAFSPVAVTPDELGPAWADGKIHLRIESYINDKLFGQPACGVDMTFNFYELIAHVTKTRRLRAGTILGSGTVSNYDRSQGSACIAEKRMLETLESGAPRTPFLKFGDRVRIEMHDATGASIFGAIDQRVTAISPFG
jgi:fumarylacetoacetate (FAA) hydrolase